MKKKISNTEKLTAMFQGQSPTHFARRDQLYISYTSQAGAAMKIYPQEGPSQTAAYLRKILTSDDDMLRRHQQPEGMEALTIPVIFYVQGELFDKRKNDIDNDMRLARLRFFQPDEPGELCFDTDFPTPDSQLAQMSQEGPSLNEFLDILDAAGNDWRNVDFSSNAVHPALARFDAKTAKYKF